MRIVKLTFISDVDGGAEFSSDAKSAEFLASTNSSQMDSKGGGGGGVGGAEGGALSEISKLAQVFRGVTDKVKGYGTGGIDSKSDVSPLQ